MEDSGGAHGGGLGMVGSMVGSNVELGWGGWWVGVGVGWVEGGWRSV